MFIRYRAVRSASTGVSEGEGEGEGLERDSDEEEELLKASLQYPRSALNLTPLEYPSCLFQQHSLSSPKLRVEERGGLG